MSRLRKNHQVPRGSAVRRRLAVASFIAGVALLALGPWFAGADETLNEEAPGVVYHARVDSIIHPVAADFIEESLAAADLAGAEVFILELSTPGGLLTSTREIDTAILGADTPVVVYVSPSGAQAASAGFFVLMAGDVAAMAPGTNTGAAHPVSGTGETIEGDMADKVEQDAAATIRSLAARNGRNEELAEAAVMESRSFTAEEALENDLIDLISDDLSSLLVDLEGFEVGQDADDPIVLHTQGARVETLEMSGLQRFLSAIAHPNIAYILMTLGGLGLYFELSNPGAILPGVVGGICLILAFFALSVLPVNYAGIALIFLALIFFIAEIKVASYGLLTVGGVISLVLGSLMLFKSADPAIRVSLEVIASITLFSLVVVGFLMFMVLRIHRTQVKTGVEGLIHREAVVRKVLDPKGKVFVSGEIWNAVADHPVAVGEMVEIIEVKGMMLRVRPISGNESPTDVGG